MTCPQNRYTAYAPILCPVFQLAEVLYVIQACLGIPDEFGFFYPPKYTPLQLMVTPLFLLAVFTSLVVATAEPWGRGIYLMFRCLFITVTIFWIQMALIDYIAIRECNTQEQDFPEILCS
ncbi:hypothetical protein ACRE_070410 [Hapsidospora chrysogenum ATCC 11550]|uniref:Uncharacterized protein n=1 Tax=Hapsidospora chrysogenum (strain ATCC 11550 / CBS 779.69 / DSM 880 / IAM 14645 / JCM 23072 / IMI 49137) TaxID=857340 RepID=A0A086SYS0_HAPC1|nr:hypothetical protein ACRE_070410 [Hapsidospora chrysogenum ATCC 11550]